MITISEIAATIEGAIIICGAVALPSLLGLRWIAKKRPAQESQKKFASPRLDFWRPDFEPLTHTRLTVGAGTLFDLAHAIFEDCPGMKCIHMRYLDPSSVEIITHAPLPEKVVQRLDNLRTVGTRLEYRSL